MAFDPYSATAVLAGKAIAVAGIAVILMGGLWYWRWSGADAQQAKVNQAVDHAAADAAEGTAQAQQANSAKGDQAVRGKLTREAKDRANSASAEGALAPLATVTLAPDLDLWIKARARERRSAFPQGAAGAPQGGK